MNYRIVQEEHYLHNGRWNWSAWIEASDNDLNQIEIVTWILHPTFTPSRIENCERSRRFRIDTSGWGTFVLRAQLQLKSSSEPIVLKHTLRLDYPDESEISGFENAPGDGPDLRVTTKSPRVFISYSSEDKLQAEKIRSQVELLGARALDASTINADLPFEAAIRKMIRESDAVVSVIGSNYLSPWVFSELKLAQSEDKPTIAMLSNDISWPEGLSREGLHIRFSQGTDTADLDLADFVGKLKG